MSPPKLLWHAAEDGTLGVFSARQIQAGEVVERCYCLPVMRTGFGQSQLGWLYDCDELPLLFAFGWGLLYNEVPVGGSVQPNLTWDYEIVSDGDESERHYITLHASRNIAARKEELCVVRRYRAKEGTLRNIFEETSSQCGFSLDRGLVRSPSPLSIEVRHSSLHGNGVFAKRAFKQGETVEVVPTLNLELGTLHYALRDYAFGDPLHCGIWLGYGAIYNHSFSPNIIGCQGSLVGCDWAYDLCTSFIALRDIAAGEELCHNYGSGYWTGCLLRYERPSLWDIGKNALSWGPDSLEDLLEDETPSAYNYVDDW